MRSALVVRPLRRLRSVAFPPVVIVAVLVAAGCGPDLDRCDQAAADRVVFQSQTGIPAYEGQAMIQTSCGSGAGFCHAEGAEGSDRIGVPAGLNFDLPVACVDGECNSASAERLRRGRAEVIDRAHAVAVEVDRGDMPPGAEGSAVSDEGRRLLDYRDVSGNALPEIGSSEGKEIIRNWLACGASVVEKTVEPPSPGQAGELCQTVEPGETGECVYRGEGACDLEPTWPSIYECILSNTCIQCHGPGPLDQRSDSGLDFETQSIAYTELLGADMMGAPAEGTSCGGMGILVVPGDPEASLLVQKVEAAVDTSVSVCGDPMPVASALSQEEIDAIRTWIAAGALPDG